MVDKIHKKISHQKINTLGYDVEKTIAQLKTVSQVKQ